jgi:hypothetical protein
MLKIERTTDESNKKKRALEEEIMDTTSFQVNELTRHDRCVHRIKWHERACCCSG